MAQTPLIADMEEKTESGKTKPATKKTAKNNAAKALYAEPLFTKYKDGLSEREAVAAADKALQLLTRIRENIGKIIFGQETVIELVLTTLLAGGHALLIGVPGLAKTRLAESLGLILGLEEKRIQFTPDLMPADIIGSEILEEDIKGKRSFRYIQGPVFAQLLMADEINRAGPRTQAALLQAMQEYHVTIAGKRYNLPQPFHVLATQNPLEQEGTYPLPEAQLDRFLMQITLSYPDRETEKRIALATTGIDLPQAQTALCPARLIEMQTLVRALPIPENVLDAILNLVRACRPIEKSKINNAAMAERTEETRENNVLQNYIAWGPGPRAVQALALCVRARALLKGRLAPEIADVEALAQPVLLHRMALNFAAKAENIDLATMIDHVAKRLGRSDEWR